MIVENLSTRATWPRWPHHPEVIIRGNADNFIVRQARNFFPHICSFIICMVDGDAKLFFWNIQLFGDQFPCKWDSFTFEIVAKGKIAHHFEKCVMPCCVSHIVQIIMLAAGANAFLCCRCPFVITGFDAREEVFKLNHAGIGKHQRGIIARNKRA